MVMIEAEDATTKVRAVLGGYTCSAVLRLPVSADKVADNYGSGINKLIASLKNRGKDNECFYRTDSLLVVRKNPLGQPTGRVYFS
mgnify:CR=1 FL=1